MDLGSSVWAIEQTYLGQNRKENYGFYILVYHVDFISCGTPVYGAMGVKWTTITFKQLAAQKNLRMDAGYWLKRQASSCKRQASSSCLTRDPGSCRMNLERNNYGQQNIKKNC